MGFMMIKNYLICAFEQMSPMIFKMKSWEDCFLKNDEEIEESSKVKNYRSKLEEAEGLNEVWNIVKASVKSSLGEHRGSMMLFLDDLPLHLGAYHPLGTNNIVLNRTLVQIVEAATDSKLTLNAFVYSILIHEYLHALGHVPENGVRRLVYEVSQKCFGQDYIVTRLAKESPWIILKGIPLNEIEVPKHVIEVVKNFEKSNLQYII